MKMRALNLLAAGIVVGLLSMGTAQAAPVLCQDPDDNHMLIDDSIASACLDAGVGNIQGDGPNDVFLNGSAGGDYDFITKFGPGDGGWTQTNSTGTFSFDSSLWGSFGDIAVGFKFGTGNQADEWFVYSLQSGVSSGDWLFVNVHGPGGGLSHVNLYGAGDPATVPEPTTLALFGLGLVGFGVVRRAAGA